MKCHSSGQAAFHQLVPVVDYAAKLERIEAKDLLYNDRLQQLKTHLAGEAVAEVVSRDSKH